MEASLTLRKFCSLTLDSSFGNQAHQDRSDTLMQAQRYKIQMQRPRIVSLNFPPSLLLIRIRGVVSKAKNPCSIAKSTIREGFW
jgi:hypothetical protein